LKTRNPVVLIHQPGHGLGICSEIGRWNITLGAEHVGKFPRPSANELLFLERRELRSINRDAAFGTAEGNIEERRLPCHQTRKCADVVEVDVLVEPNPTLPWAARTRVLDSVSGQDVHVVVKTAHRDRYYDLALALTELRDHAGF